MDRNPVFEATLHALVKGLEEARERVDRLARSENTGFFASWIQPLLRQVSRFRCCDTRLHCLLRHWPQQTTHIIDQVDRDVDKPVWELLTELHTVVGKFFPDSPVDDGGSSTHRVSDWVISAEWDFLMRKFLPHFFGCRVIQKEAPQIFTCDKSEFRSWKCDV